MSKNSLEETKLSISQLKERNIWTNWIFITKNGKQTKKPLAKVNVPASWVTFSQAESRTKETPCGIGVMFAQISATLSLCGIDIDAHHVDTNPLTREILELFQGTYIEKSPSGKGYHVLFLARLDKLPEAQEYKKRYLQKNSKLDVECYLAGITNRYFTFTGNQVSEGDYITDKTDTLLEFLEKYMKIENHAEQLPLNFPLSVGSEQLKLTGGEETEKKKPEKRDSIPIDINQRLTVAMHASNGEKFSSLYNGNTDGYASHSEAVQALVNMLVFYFGEGGTEIVKDVFKQSGLASGKWAERDSIINTTIDKAFQRVSDRYSTCVSAPKGLTIGNKKSSQEGGAEQLPDWEEKLEEIYNESERIHQENIQSGKKSKQKLNYRLFTACLQWLSLSVSYNIITHKFEFSGLGDKESPEHLPETVPTILYDPLNAWYKDVTKALICDYITRYATRNKYNPILDAIQAVKWDGKDRIEEIYTIFRIPPESVEEGKYSRIFIRKWLMQCVCGLFNTIDKPYSLDIILVFQGKQGIGKTRFFEKLALKSQYFGEGMCLDPRDKDSVIQATSKWISELGEISSTMRKDMDSVKAFLTKSTDEYRTPYGKATLHYPRMTSFVGTVNDEQFLIDQTGNRRFVTIPLVPDLVIDYETQIEPFDALQLWSQVYELVKDKDKARCFRLTEDEKQYLEKRNASFIKPMKAEQEVLDTLAYLQMPETGYTCTMEEMTVTQFMQNNGLQRYDARDVGKALKKHGYESKKKKINGKVIRIVKLPIKTPTYKNGYGQNGFYPVAGKDY